MTKRNRSCTALLRSIWRSIRRKYSAQLAFSAIPYLGTLHPAALPIRIHRPWPVAHQKAKGPVRPFKLVWAGKPFRATCVESQGLLQRPEIAYATSSSCHYLLFWSSRQTPEPMQENTHNTHTRTRTRNTKLLCWCKYTYVHTCICSYTFCYNSHPNSRKGVAN